MVDELFIEPAAMTSENCGTRVGGRDVVPDFGHKASRVIRVGSKEVERMRDDN